MYCFSFIYLAIPKQINSTSAMFNANNPSVTTGTADTPTNDFINDDASE